MIQVNTVPKPVFGTNDSGFAVCSTGLGSMGYGNDTQSYIQTMISSTQLELVTIVKTGSTLTSQGKNKSYKQKSFIEFQVFRN